MSQGTLFDYYPRRSVLKAIEMQGGGELSRGTEVEVISGDPDTDEYVCVDWRETDCVGHVMVVPSALLGPAKG